MKWKYIYIDVTYFVHLNHNFRFGPGPKGEKNGGSGRIGSRPPARLVAHGSPRRYATQVALLARSLQCKREDINRSDKCWHSAIYSPAEFGNSCV